MTTEPKSIHIPIDAVKPGQILGGDRATGLTVYYNTAPWETGDDPRVFALIHPIDPEDTEVGWPVTEEGRIYGSEGAEVKALALGRRGWWLSPDDLPVLPLLVGTARERDRKVEAAADLSREATAAHRRHAQDIEVISEMLIDEADSRGWCNEYDEFVEGVNERLYYKLQERERDFDVEIQVTYTFTQTVEARNEHEARALFENDAEEHVDHDKADRWSYQSLSVESVDRAN